MFSSRWSEASNCRMRFCTGTFIAAIVRGVIVAGRCEAVAGLEAFHGVGEILVEGAARLVGGKIAGDDQPLAQEIVIGALGAEREFGVCRDRRPAAAHGEIGIAQRRILDALGGSFVIGRLMRQRERRGRAALCRRSGRRRGGFRCGCVGRIGGGRHRACSRRPGPGLSNGLGLSKRRGARKHADGNDHRMAFRHVSHLPHESEARTGARIGNFRFAVLISRNRPEASASRLRLP